MEDKMANSSYSIIAAVQKLLDASHMCSSHDGLINPLGGRSTEDECVQACRNISWPGNVLVCACAPHPLPSTSTICFLPSSLA